MFSFIFESVLCDLCEVAMWYFFVVCFLVFLRGTFFVEIIMVLSAVFEC